MSKRIVFGGTYSYQSFKKGFRINWSFADSGTIKINIKIGVKIPKTSFPRLEKSLQKMNLPNNTKLYLHEIKT